jgi:hypothetical protein
VGDDSVGVPGIAAVIEQQPGVCAAIAEAHEHGERSRVLSSRGPSRGLPDHVDIAPGIGHVRGPRHSPRVKTLSP